MANVTLVYVPFGSLERPSLALGLLKSALRDTGIACDVRYSTFPFAERVGLELYGKLAWVRDEMLGEWVFSQAAFPDFSAPGDYLQRALASFYQPEDIAGAEFGRRYLEFAREQAVEFIEDEARAILATGTRIVGVSSTFNQNCAMLALTRRIKELSPGTVTVCGGANCEGEMGTTIAQCFPWVDYVVSGEAEASFPALCVRLLADPVAPQPGDLPAGVLSGVELRSPLTTRDNRPSGPAAPSALPSPRVGLPVQQSPRAVQASSMDAIPLPDFTDYFVALSEYRDRDCVTPGLVVETARGCWWGAIHHCTFCGLNGGTMTFRSKSVGRVIAELSELSEDYGLNRFLVADNILDQSYYRELLPALAKRGEAGRYDLYLEIKANVTKDQLRALHAAGARWLVAGIESLSDDLLRLMDKGTTGWINLQVLKWSRELGIHMSWNMLAGLPGEQDEWFAKMASIIGLITHLEPPNDVRNIRFDRFSPYQARPSDYGLTLRPSWPYEYIYPLPVDVLSKLVYFFEADDRSPVRLNPFRRGLAMEESMPSMGGPGRNALARAVRSWVQAFRSATPPLLSMTQEPDRTSIRDTREIALAERVYLSGAAHRVHRACDRALSVDRVVAVVNDDGGPELPAAEINSALAELVDRRLIIKLDSKYLSLAVAGVPPALPWENEDGFPGGWFVYPRPVRYPEALEEFMNREAEGANL